MKRLGAIVTILLAMGGLTSGGELADSVRFISRVSGALRWVSEIGLGRPYVDWILQKVDLLQMYVTAGSTLAERLDPELLDALFAAYSSSSSDGRRSVDYDSKWGFYGVPSYVRKSKTKLRDEETSNNEDEDLVGSYGHSHGSYGGGGYGGGGHGGGGYGGGGYGGGGHGGGGYGGGGYGGGGHGGGGYGGYGGGGHGGGGGYGGGGYGGGGYGGDYGGGHGGGGYGGYGGGGHGGGGYGGGYDDSGKAFSILGGLSFLTFLGVLLYQLATASAAGRSFHISDMNVPLQLSDVYHHNNVTADGLHQLDQVLSFQEAMLDEDGGDESGSAVDRMVGAFNTLWKAHQSGSFRCVQRRLCETLTDPRNRPVARDPLIQMAMVAMLDWLGDYDAAEMADRTLLMMSNSKGNFDCSALVPKCRSFHRTSPLIHKSL